MNPQLESDRAPPPVPSGRKGENTTKKRTSQSSLAGPATRSLAKPVTPKEQ